MSRGSALILLAFGLIAASAFGAIAGSVPAAADPRGVPAYDHIFVIVEEN